MTLAYFAETVLPALNASCNACSFIAIICGYRAIRRRDITTHRNWMITAFSFSMLFLVGYLTRYGLTGSTPFQGQGVARVFYFTVLISHSILAILNLPLVITSLILGLRNRIEKHRSLVRLTLPIWSYVSLTGVLIYFMLYHLFRN